MDDFVNRLKKVELELGDCTNEVDFRIFKEDVAATRVHL